MSEEKQADIITTKQAAQLIKTSDERIRQLCKDGWFQKQGHGKYHLVAVVQGYIAFLKDAERRASKSAASSRMQDLKTEKAALELQVAQRELLPRDDLYAASDFISATVKNEMLGLPARLTRDLDERAAIDNEVRNALNREITFLSISGRVSLAVHLK